MKQLLSLIVCAILSTPMAFSAEPANSDMTENAKAILEYLNQQSGQAMLAGAHVGRGPLNGNADLEYIVNNTGNYPAILGLDVGIYAARYSEDFNRQLENVYKDAKKYWDEGGLVTLCWHWGNPLMERNSYQNTKKPFDIKKALQKGTDEHKAMMKDLDITAETLKKLQKDNVPILWRPLHEMGGTWFWWGKQGPDTFQKLWKFIYNYYTDEHELNNLIWVYSASTKLQTEWYPGNDYVDIIGIDLYTAENMVDQEVYVTLAEMAEGHRPIALTENDHIPDPAVLKEKGFLWSWFLTWHTEWLRRNSLEHLQYIYNHRLVLTRDELPAFPK